MDEVGNRAAGDLSGYTYPRGPQYPSVEGRSMADVMKDIIASVQELVRSEVRLAKAEVREESTKLASSAKMLAIGAVVGLYAVAFLLLAVARLLAHWMDPWLAALVVGGVLAVVAGVCAMKGKGQLQTVSPMPEKTIETVKENVEWMKNQSKS